MGSIVEWGERIAELGGGGVLWAESGNLVWFRGGLGIFRVMWERIMSIWMVNKVHPAGCTFGEEAWD